MNKNNYSRISGMEEEELFTEQDKHDNICIYKNKIVKCNFLINITNQNVNINQQIDSG